MSRAWANVALIALHALTLKREICKDVNHKEWKISRQVNCNSYNIVYAIYCLKENCKKVYIGEIRECSSSAWQTTVAMSPMGWQVRPLVNISICQATPWLTLGSQSLNKQQESLQNIEKKENIITLDNLTHSTTELTNRNSYGEGEDLVLLFNIVLKYLIY